MLHLTKKIIILTIACLFLAINTSFAADRATKGASNIGQQRKTIRCVNDLVQLGDRSFQVLEKCGQPISRELIGWSIGRYAERELTLEEWVYGPANGFFTHLIFEGNQLVEIRQIRQKF